MNMRLWLWWKLWTYLKPLCSSGLTADRIKELEQKVENQKAQMKEEERMLEYVSLNFDSEFISLCVLLMILQGIWQRT